MLTNVIYFNFYVMQNIHRTKHLSFDFWQHFLLSCIACIHSMHLAYGNRYNTVYILLSQSVLNTMCIGIVYIPVWCHKQVSYVSQEPDNRIPVTYNHILRSKLPWCLQ